MSVSGHKQAKPITGRAAANTQNKQRGQLRKQRRPSIRYQICVQKSYRLASRIFGSFPFKKIISHALGPYMLLWAYIWLKYVKYDSNIEYVTASQS